MDHIAQLAKLIRYFSLVATTKAGSGHATSSLSAADLMSVLFFSGFFHFDSDNPQNKYNDRLIFSKGHASPLFYALWVATGAIPTDELMTLRQFGSRLEGHPTLEFPYTEVPTGSLGQGLSVGLGMAINAKYIEKLPYRTYVLLGDSEMAEGSVWEAMQLAAHYKLNNLIGIIDVNRLGQRGETMYGHDTNAYQNRIRSFDWETIPIDGHSLQEISDAYIKANHVTDKPVMIIAKTIKGKGISFLENKEGWHGKALSAEELQNALKELDPIDTSVREMLHKPEAPERETVSNFVKIEPIKPLSYDKNKPIATRKAYGNALVRLFSEFPAMVVLDAEVSNSTYAEDMKKVYPERFFEMYIAEQNMVGVALGLARRGQLPFVSTFAAFFTRAFDQIRMAGYAKANIKFVGSHAGASIGEDGSSQMALEDIALFRSIFGSTVLYPSDAVATEKLIEEAARHDGLVYIRTTRKETPVLYDTDDVFPIGGSKILRSSEKDEVTIIGAGVTLHEALLAYEELKKQDVSIRVIDLYSIKPIDQVTLTKAASETKVLIVVEDHYSPGGIAEAVRTALGYMQAHIISLSVEKMPRSGKPQELLEFEEISANAIIKKVKEVI